MCIEPDSGACCSTHNLCSHSTVHLFCSCCRYAEQGLLCGTDGLPHLIADPGLALRYGHAGDVFVSGPTPPL